MKRDRKSTGRSDAGLDRAEALLDEAVGQAAKGSYGEAAEKARQALDLDPDNTAARDLLDSYRRQVTDDDEKRRRRRSIAAAAAAIEEMVENDRLEEASSATDALVMQFGVDAPVEDLRRRIAEARAELLDFDELDAAIDSIRVNDARPSQSGRAEPGGAIAAEVEEHLRAGRLEEASRAVSRLEQEPSATERALKMRTRVEEAMHVAAEHRREEEILIATAAIEERIRRGNVDDAAERLAELARRHGDSAPVAELGQRLAEARALGVQTVVAGEFEAAPETVSPNPVSAPMFGSMVEKESSGGRGMSIAIAAAVVVALGAGAWWFLQGGDENAAPAASEAAATVAGGVGEGLSPAGSTEAQPSTADATEPSPAADASAPPPAAAPVAPPTARENAASAPAPVAAAPATATGTQATNPPPRASSQVAAAPPPAAVEVPPTASAQEPPPVESSQSESSSVLADDPPAQPPSAPATAEVVVEAVPATEIPPPPPPAPVVPPPASSSPATTDAAPAPAESAVQEPPPRSEAAPPPPAESRPATVAEAPRAAAPQGASGPAMLGCGDPGVVCVKALQVPQPRYPAAARARRLSGDVVVMALVNEQGRVVQARVDSPSFAFFNEAALDAARRATFQPATRQGVAGQSWARLTFKFEEQ